ncbi:unnamed protein product, partial [Brenthis ino]
MAKSNKKVRSDRINALRKQYDAFLEEDKKRRDRNEFILGHLEKMRLGSPVPISVYHEKTQVVSESYYPFSQRSEFLNKLSCRDTNKHIILNQSVPLPTYSKNLEETTILKEISQKFILIPKLQSALHNNTTYPLIENIQDSDWRSKYNILDELKRNEKETTDEKNDYVFGSTEDHKTTGCVETPTLLQFDHPLLDDYIKPPPKDLSNESVINVVSKDETPYLEWKPVAKVNFNIPEENRKCNQRTEEQTDVLIKNNQCDLNIEANGMSENNKIINEIHEQTIVGSDNKNREEGNLVRYNTPTEARQQSKIDENVDTLHEIHEGKISDNFDVAIHPQEIIKENVININDNKGLEINNDQVDNSTADTQQQCLNLQQETVQQPIQPCPEINQELISNDKVDIAEVFQENIEKHENDDVLLNNPENYESNEAPIEQLTNFEVNYENNHKVTNADGDKNYENSQENNESENYVAENEHYTNEYAYYDESQQGEPYVGEINEHVESTEQYDPNYEQQYTNNYEDPTMAQYQNNQFEENMYQQQQEANNITYDNQQPDNANVEYVNSDNIEVTDQNQHENVYNYENEMNDQQQYDDNIKQEYSTVQHEQYEEQQEYIEPETLRKIENELDSEDGFIEKINTNLKENVESINESEDITKNIESDVQLS